MPIRHGLKNRHSLPVFLFAKKELSFYNKATSTQTIGGAQYGSFR
ncbi:predicted protein [Listeria monocytogenes J2818]|nr:predicted protein [Listeria monocytogenes J2818]